MNAFLTIECQDDLTVRTRLKVIRTLKVLANALMVIYLAVHGKHLLSVGRVERLLARLRIYDRQSLMTQNGCPSGINTAPVRTAMTYFLRHAQRLLT